MRAVAVLIAVFGAVLALDAIEGLKPFGGLPAPLGQAAEGFAAFVLGALPFAIVETVSAAPERARRPVSRYLMPLAIWAAFYAMSNLVILAASWVKAETGLARGTGMVELPGLLELALYILLIDFFGYWFHRAEHAVPFLWKFHCTHHSLEHLNAVNSYGHWLEGVFRFAFVFLPVSILVPTPEPNASAIAVVWGTWVIYTHSDARALVLPAGARKVLVDNLFHHYHHGREKRLHDCNFGFFLSIWDRLFGTRVEPRGADFPETGLDGMPPPSDPISYVAHPFVRRRG